MLAKVLCQGDTCVVVWFFFFFFVCPWQIPAGILYKSTAGRYRPDSYPDWPITTRCRFIKNAYWDATSFYLNSLFGPLSRPCFILNIFVYVHSIKRSLF